MQSRWLDAEAREFVDRYREHGEDLALRVYTSRLIGADPDLVLHGGGNTSVKTAVRDRLGRTAMCLCVKGSGADLVEVEPAGLPALELEPLLSLRQHDTMDDAAMANELRRRLLDASAPNPSVEALLHAFLPHKFVDHTHADAVLALTNQPDGERLVRAALGDRVAVLPWIMPGFPLAKAVAEAFERQPDCVGVVLLQHGIFTFGDTARQSYERMIELVDQCEQFLAARIGPSPRMLQPGPDLLPAAARRQAWLRVLPVLRGVLALDNSPFERRLCFLADVRSADALAAFSQHEDAPRLCATGPITPDHVIRTKGRYLFLTQQQAGDRAAVEQQAAEYIRWYKGYFESCARPLGAPLMLHPSPPVVVVEGLGLVALAPSRKAAGIAADLAEHTLKVWAQGRDLGRYEPLPERELAAMEYWPLELQKLGKQKPPLLAGRIALVTGAAGAIGCATVGLLLAHGACVLAADLDEAGLLAVARRHARHGGMLQTCAADLRSPQGAQAVFDACTWAFGGLDLLVQSHGIAAVARLSDLDAERFAQVMDVNAKATMLVLQQAARVWKAQGTGGAAVLQVSKNAFAPGAGFGAYSASKAAALQLGRIAALELAELGVRVNMINADAVFGDDEVQSRLWQEVGPDRMKARGLDEVGLRDFYRERSLLKRPVTPEVVAEAVLFLCTQAAATTGAVLPVDSGLPEAFPR